MMAMHDSTTHLSGVGMDQALRAGAGSEDWPGWAKAAIILGLTGLLWTLIISGVALVMPLVRMLF